MTSLTHMPAKMPPKLTNPAAHNELLKRRAMHEGAPISAMPIVYDVLRSSGQPLDPGTRTSMESRFGHHFNQVRVHANVPKIAQSSLTVNQPGDIREREAQQVAEKAVRTPAQATAHNFEPRARHDFGQVRVHIDAQADRSARAMNARAYTVGSDIVFRRGQYAPGTAAGGLLLAHELTHVLQQSGTVGLTAAEPSIQRWWPFEEVEEKFSRGYEEAKEKSYRGLIEGARQARASSINLLRRQVTRLPESQRGAANTLVDVVDVIFDLLIQVDFAIVGLLVGFGEGIVDMIVGLVKLTYSVIKLLVDLVLGVFDNWETFKNDIDAITTGLKNIVPGLKKLVADWIEKFKKSPPERGTFMIAELFGQIEALIFTWEVAATKAAQAPKLIVPTVRFEAAVTTTGELATVPAVAAMPVNVAAPAAAAGLVGAPVMQIQGGGGGGSQSPSQAGSKAKPRIRESTGASPRGSQFESASAQKPQALKTAIQADIGESEAYKEALRRGEIGLQRSQGANWPGADFITAVERSDDTVEIIVTDVKTSTVGKFPKPDTTLPATWRAEVEQAIAPGRLGLGDPALEAKIRQAFTDGRIRVRQLNADYSPTGQGTITGF